MTVLPETHHGDSSSFFLLRQCSTADRSNASGLRATDQRDPIRQPLGRAERLYDAECDIPANISKEELERRIEVFGAGHYGIDLTVMLHGHPFRIAPDAENKVNSSGTIPAEPIVESVQIDSAASLLHRTGVESTGNSEALSI